MEGRLLRVAGVFRDRITEGFGGTGEFVFLDFGGDAARGGLMFLLLFNRSR
jgi:hypothetical protein